MRLCSVVVFLRALYLCVVVRFRYFSFFFFFNDTATTEIYTLSLHDALPIYIFDLLLAHVFEREIELVADLVAHHPADANTPRRGERLKARRDIDTVPVDVVAIRSEEHTSELQSLTNLVCRLLLEKKNKNTKE